MFKLRSLIDKAVVRLYRKSEYESSKLRKYFYDIYGIDVGLYTIGAFDRWRIPPGTRIGRYCSIARSARLLDANHPISNLSTHPYFYLSQFGIVNQNKVKTVAPIIEDDVWIGHNAIITPECHKIGRGAVIGAGAVVMSDVPPYAVMIGAPAKFARFRFDEDTINIIEASRWWTFERHDLGQFAKVASSFLQGPSRATAEPFFEIAAIGPVPDRLSKLEQAAVSDNMLSGRADDLRIVLRSLAPKYTEAYANDYFSTFGLDSFGLIELRLAAEQLFGRQIPDSRWGSVHTPSDFFALAGIETQEINKTGSKSIITPPPSYSAPVLHDIPASNKNSAAVSRKYNINMPQMSQRGLSENWLFKELGDIHWQSLTQGLGVASADIADSDGNRLYATFTRIKLEIPRSLRYFRENQSMSINLEPARYGAGMFFGEAVIQGSETAGKCELMTSFSKFGESGANTSLLKGQPLIPENCAIRALSSSPPFVGEYRLRRAEDLGKVLFETSYDILPPHDINGVGLLYFAAYPMITDLCAMRWNPIITSEDYSTTTRDVYYFANAAPDEKLVFRVHEYIESDKYISYTTSISRASDNVTMNRTYTQKMLINRDNLTPG